MKKHYHVEMGIAGQPPEVEGAYFNRTQAKQSLINLLAALAEWGIRFRAIEADEDYYYYWARTGVPAANGPYRVRMYLCTDNNPVCRAAI